VSDLPVDDWTSIPGEEARRKVLATYPLDLAPHGAELDAMARLAAQVCATPIALVSIVAAETQEFHGRSGLDAQRTPREQSFCAHAMHLDTAMIVPDATRDERFANNPLVTGAPHIRFYAGHPLKSPEGAPLGSLCVIDDKPREGLTEAQRDGLEVMAKAVMALLERWRLERASAAAAAQSQITILDLEQRFATLADAMPQMVWSTSADGAPDYFNAQWVEFTGQPAAASYGAGWLSFLNPDDAEIAQRTWNNAVESGQAYEVEYRLRNARGEYRWVLARGTPQRDADGNVTRWFGTCTDIHESREQASRLEVLSQELSHRIKNIFAVVGGLVSLTMRKRPDMQELSRELQGRILALGRAHNFVRPHGPGSAPIIAGGSGIKAMLENLLGAYQDTGGGRVTVEGEDIAIDDRSATPLALYFHELATNSAKYGGLAALDGGVAVGIERDGDDAVLTWCERGGAPADRPGSDGFGTRLMQLSIETQLGGKLERRWNPDGLSAVARVPISAMSRGQPPRVLSGASGDRA
jgi:PAS domain S-box-containing protein